VPISLLSWFSGAQSVYQFKGILRPSRRFTKQRNLGFYIASLSSLGMLPKSLTHLTCLIVRIRCYDNSYITRLCAYCHALNTKDHSAPDRELFRPHSLDFVCDYLPMQKLENIFPRRSSLVNSPVICPNACCALRSSSANNSPDPKSSNCSRPLTNEISACLSPSR